MSKEQKYQGWIHSGFFSGLQKLSVPLSGVLITMILAHDALTVEEMGIWGLFMTITAIIEIIRQGLVKTSLIKFINYCQPEEEPLVIGAAFFLNALITLSTALVLFIFTPWIAGFLHAPALENMLYLLQIGILIMIPFSHFEWLMYGKVQFKGLFWVYFFRQGLTLLCVFILYLLFRKINLISLVIIYNAALLLGALIAYGYVKLFLKNSFTFSKHWVFKLLNFGKYVFATGISSLVFRSADQILLSPILNTVIFNGPQGIAMRFVNLSDLPSQTLGDILFPKSSQKEASDNPARIKYYYEKTVGASLCFVLPLVLFVMLFPKVIIYILAGPDYYTAVPYLQLISLSCITLAYLKQYGVILDSTGRPQLNLITLSFLAVFHVGATYFLITHFKFMGAGYALMLSHTIGFIFTQLVLYKIFKINFLNSFKYAFQFYPEFFKIIVNKLPWKKKL